MVLASKNILPRIDSSYEQRTWTLFQSYPFGASKSTDHEGHDEWVNTYSLADAMVWTKVRTIGEILLSRAARSG